MYFLLKNVVFYGEQMNTLDTKWISSYEIQYWFPDGKKKRKKEHVAHGDFPCSTKDDYCQTGRLNASPTITESGRMILYMFMDKDVSNVDLHGLSHANHSFTST